MSNLTGLSLKPHLITSFKVILLMTFILGLIYPLMITIISQVFFKDKANGSLLKVNGHVIGSSLIAQKTQSDKYFWPRPSNSDYGTIPSGASNLGPTSTKLKEIIDDRKSKNLVSDLLFSSGSGIDPHISVEAALSQIPRIAKSRNLKEIEIQKILDLVHNSIESRDFGILGEPRINVLLLNIKMDKEY